MKEILINFQKFGCNFKKKSKNFVKFSKATNYLVVKSSMKIFYDAINLKKIKIDLNFSKFKRRDIEKTQNFNPIRFKFN